MGALVNRRKLPPFLIPLLRAYFFGYASSVSPRLLQILISRVRKKSSAEKTETLQKITATLKKALEFYRFPAFCGVTIGGWRILQPVVERILEGFGNPDSFRKNPAPKQRLATFVASLISGALGLQLLNQHPRAFTGGRTLDLTLFTVGRALDVLVNKLWGKWKARRSRKGGWTRAEELLARFADPLVFSLSSGIIMFAWFYLPERLPKAYNKWITDISEIDMRILYALRRLRDGSFFYGRDTGQAHILGSYCQDLGLPKVLGDPKVTVPIPCELVHAGVTKNCELHALYKFWRGWRAAFIMYLPLNLLMRAKNPSTKKLLRALLDSARSSAFLGAFVALFYASVCMTRSRIGPTLFPKVDPMFWDDTTIVNAGCATCGWSVLIEPPSRRTEMAFFVVPRALGVLLPRTYDKKYQWAETMAFALSFALVVTTFRHDRKNVRGVFGRLLSTVLV